MINKQQKLSQNSMKKREKTYKLLSMNLKIVYKDRVEDEDGVWKFGCCRFDASDATIEISTHSDSGRKLTKDEIEATLRHELFHFIFDTLYYKDNSVDESLVEWLANATLILNKQGLTI
jgi:hypothetical protein